MTNHPNRNWRNRWRVDLAACTATHRPTGIVVEFVQAEPGAWDGKIKQIDQLNQMIAEGGASVQSVARLLREAGEIYKENLDKRQ